MKIVALLAALCACLLIFGGMLDKRDRMTVKAIESPRLLTVVVSMPDLTSEYRWLSVHGCSADVFEHGVFCNGFFEMESSREIGNRKQELFDWRDVPKGTLLLTAMAFDVNHGTLAAGTRVVFR